MLILDSQPTLPTISSQMATENQFKTPIYERWISELNYPRDIHRKWWEFVFVLSALDEFRMLNPNKKGVGFGVGEEPIPALLAKYGCGVLATEFSLTDGWWKSSSREELLRKMNSTIGCDFDKLSKLVEYRDVDMNAIPNDIKGYDFAWSCCSLDHLGSKHNAYKFIRDSMKCLKKGGLAVYTTEYVCHSLVPTPETGPTVYFTILDIIQLAEVLVREGNRIELNLNEGMAIEDRHVDYPPYTSHHVKLFVPNIGDITSIGLIIQKG